MSEWLLMTHTAKVYVVSRKKMVNHSKNMANCNKNMVLLLNYSKGKVEKANCTKSQEVEANCYKNIVKSSKSKGV